MKLHNCSDGSAEGFAFDTTYAYDDNSNITGIQTELPNGESMSGTFGYDELSRLTEVELYHYRARVYDPELGIFLQHDPVFGANPYAYVDNDPINMVDPLGLDSVSYTYDVQGPWYCKNTLVDKGRLWTVKEIDKFEKDCPSVKEDCYQQRAMGSYNKRTCRQCVLKERFVDECRKKCAESTDFKACYKTECDVDATPGDPAAGGPIGGGPDDPKSDAGGPSGDFCGDAVCPPDFTDPDVEKAYEIQGEMYIEIGKDLICIVKNTAEDILPLPYDDWWSIPGAIGDTTAGYYWGLSAQYTAKSAPQTIKQELKKTGIKKSLKYLRPMAKKEAVKYATAAKGVSVGVIIIYAAKNTYICSYKDK